MIRLLHLADVHLGAPLGAFGSAAGSRVEEILRAFRRLPERAEEEDCHAVVIAGDLFDGPQPPAEAFATARETFRRLVEAGRPVFVIPGNHDAITLHAQPWRRDLAGAHAFLEPAFGRPERAETAGGTLYVHGLAFDPSRCAEPLETFQRRPPDGVHVAVLHGALPDAPHWEAAPGSLALPPPALAALEADYIALGDYHRFRPPEEFAGDGAPACYAGSFAALDFGETGPRGFVVAEVEAGKPPRVRHVPSGVSHVAELEELDVSACETAEEVADLVAARTPEGAVPTVTLVGVPAFRLEPDAVYSHLEARFGAARVRDDTRHYASSRLDELAEEDTIVGHVVRLGRERIEAASGEEAEVERRALRAALRELGVR